MTAPSRPSPVSEGDIFILAIAAVALFGSVGALAAAGWGRAVHWLLDHGLLVPASESPIVTLPGADGAGIDLSRLLVVTGCGLALAVLIGSRLARRWRAERDD